MNTNIAVTGCGYWGKNIVRAIYELGALYAVCDTDANLVSKIAAEYKDVVCMHDFEKVLTDRDVDAVVIATPAATHFELAKRCLNAGKDVFVEKPLALDSGHGQELVTLSEKNGRVLMVGHILNYHPVIRRLKNIIDAGELGRILYIYSNRLNFGKIRREENILWSFAPHDISTILSLVGEEPQEICARGSCYLHPDIADVTMSQLRFPSGVNAHIYVSWLHPFKEQKLVIVGDKQMAVFDDIAPWDEKLVLYPHEVVWNCGVPTARRADKKCVAGIEKAEPLKAELGYFLECVRTRQTPVTDGREGLKVLKLLNGLQNSLDQNGMVVKIRNNAPAEYFVDDSAIVENGAEIGKGAKIWHFSHVMPGAEIGEGTSIGQNCVVMKGAKVGKNVKVQNNVSIYEGVEIEDGAFLGPSMVFTNVSNPRSHISRKHEYKKTLVRRGATIGANTTVVCGNEIGEYAFIGSGAVVTKDVLPYALVYGNPARQHGWMCKCGEKLSVPIDYNGFTGCTACSSQYHIADGRVEVVHE